MKWAFTIKQKIKAASLLVLVFVIVLAKNIIDRNNVLELGESFSVVYEDRLLAESYIYHFAEHLYQKKLMFKNNEITTVSQGLKDKIAFHNRSIDSITAFYDKTTLTKNEAVYYNEFKKAVTELKRNEETYLNSSLRPGETAVAVNQMNKQLNLALLKLNQLSQIQITEGKLLNDDSKKIVSGSKILTQLELGILIIIGLIIQVLIFTSGEIVAKQPPRHPSLN
ncbi:MCP four helix bundle domain-containing protein [Solitalea lacus]|uniref:MCP four helix bundle domain-containing protein n=1 Tax=Solitalea lacus TaxID=2911172 RepID=UPI001EDA5D81|nr:MCP four helix bundle domain-containing protein [Solitalea lacus]UKJ08870.1 MCP four helix bundle domain-containing protein [Solitalea lacus]